MTEWVKWWKDKSLLAILGLGLLAVGVSLAAALLIPNAYCLCAVVPVCALCGALIRKQVVKKIIEKGEEIENGDASK